MKILAHLSRFFVGLVFVFSGFVKLQDPVGTKIKMQEYFFVFSEDVPSLATLFNFLSEHAIWVAIAMCAIELILGFALLVSFKIKQTAWALLALVVYFGFLTFYSAYFNKVTDCGCFGDFMHLKPWTSFWKDMVLLFFIVIILWKANLMQSLQTGKWVGFITAASIALGIYTYYMQPLLDFRAYKIGDNIAKNMKPTAPAVFEYVLEKEGKQQTFTKYPTDTTWKYVSMKQLNEGENPKITDFALWNAEGTFTEKAFEGKKVFVLFHSVTEYPESAIEKIKTLASSCQKANQELILLTSATDADILVFKQKTGLQLPIYFADVKVLKTIARVNPSVWTLQNATVTGKWGAYQIPDLETIQGTFK
jgi:uncharacterized membrane protein YphA (DoxX/SURF4 family)